MNLADALVKLKNLKSKVSKTEKRIEKAIIYYEEETPEYDYLAEVSNRNDLENQILNLKIDIQNTNVTTTTEFKGMKLNINSLILLNARLRTDLAFWEKLSETDLQRSVYSAKDSIKQKYAEGFSKQEIRKTIESLEKEKEEIKARLRWINENTNVLVRIPPAKTEEPSGT